MRKMVKGAAIVGGVFAIINALSSVITLFSYIRINVPAASYVQLAVTMLTTVLLAVALFRGKADVFAGVVCLLYVPISLWALIGNITSIFAFQQMMAIAMAVYALANLAQAAAFVLMAVQCFRKQGGKSMLCILAAVVAASLGVIATMVLSLSNYLSYMDMDFTLVVMLSSSLLGAVVGALPLIFAGIAIGGSKAEAPAVDYSAYQYPQYPQYPQYQQPQYPQYQEPQYQDPQQYQYQDPQYPEQN